MDKLKPEVRGALAGLVIRSTICPGDSVENVTSIARILKDELHRLTAELEKAEAERDALREELHPTKLCKTNPAPDAAQCAAVSPTHHMRIGQEGVSIDKARIVPEQDGSS